MYLKQKSITKKP